MRPTGGRRHQIWRCNFERTHSKKYRATATRIYRKAAQQGDSPAAIVKRYPRANQAPVEARPASHTRCAVADRVGKSGEGCPHIIQSAIMHHLAICGCNSYCGVFRVFAFWAAGRLGDATSSKTDGGGAISYRPRRLPRISAIAGFVATQQAIKTNHNADILLTRDFKGAVGKQKTRR